MKLPIDIMPNVMMFRQLGELIGILLIKNIIKYEKRKDCGLSCILFETCL
jgi:hypothetical protein